MTAPKPTWERTSLPILPGHDVWLLCLGDVQLVLGRSSGRWSLSMRWDDGTVESYAMAETTNGVGHHLAKPHEIPWKLVELDVTEPPLDQALELAVRKLSERLRKTLAIIDIARQTPPAPLVEVKGSYVAIAMSMGGDEGMVLRVRGQAELPAGSPWIHVSARDDLDEHDLPPLPGPGSWLWRDAGSAISYGGEYPSEMPDWRGSWIPMSAPQVLALASGSAPWEVPVDREALVLAEAALEIGRLHARVDELLIDNMVMRSQLDDYKPPAKVELWAVALPEPTDDYTMLGPYILRATADEVAREASGAVERTRQIRASEVVELGYLVDYMQDALDSGGGPEGSWRDWEAPNVVALPGAQEAFEEWLDRWIEVRQYVRDEVDQPAAGGAG